MKRSALVLLPLTVMLLGACAGDQPTAVQVDLTPRMDEEACPGGGMMGSNGICIYP